MRRPFVLTPEAKDDLRQILGDIADDSPKTADRLGSELYDKLCLSARSPGIGHFHEELLSRKFRFWNFYSYVIVYVWDAKPIQVIGVVHGARDLAVFLTVRAGRDNLTN